MVVSTASIYKCRETTMLDAGVMIFSGASRDQGKRISFSGNLNSRIRDYHNFLGKMNRPTATLFYACMLNYNHLPPYIFWVG